MLHQCTPMPGCLIHRDDHLGIRTGRRGARHIPEVRCKRHVQALLCALARLGFAARGLLEQARRQLPRHPMERRHTLDLVLVIPRADGGAMPLHPARGPSRRHQGKAGFVLAQQHARPGLGFFFYRCKSRSAQEESAAADQRVSKPCTYEDKLRRACHAFLRSSVRRNSASAA
jgi:hypothetical protein